MFRSLKIAGLCALLLLSFSAARAQQKTVRLVAFGDSLTSGLGLAQSDVFPVVLEKALRTRGYRIEIVNAGVSGDTVQAGLERLDWSIPDGTTGVILELGANDMLHGLDPALTRRGLMVMIERLEARRIPVMLMGMIAAPNLGAAYGEKFNTIYPELARKYGLILYPFFLDGVFGQPGMTQSDGTHPTGAGVVVIVERSLPSVEAFLKRIGVTPVDARSAAPSK